VVDVLTREQRSRNMASIKSYDTGPERRMSQLLRERGLKYRCRPATLPGRPDFVLQGRRVAVFVHGCYWHMHRCRFGRVVPKTNEAFWRAKRTKNVERDRRTARSLRTAGWNVVVVWECWLRDPERVARRLYEVLARRP
jgi:DNA mismatch endonuclease (patch repair protein)